MLVNMHTSEETVHSSAAMVHIDKATRFTSQKVLVFVFVATKTPNYLNLGYQPFKDEAQTALFNL
jgi:hypothetical protein